MAVAMRGVALAPVTAQRTSHRGVSPGVPAGSAAAAVQLGAAAMASNIIYVMTLLSILEYGLRVGDQTIVVTQELLQQHEEQRHQEMTWLMEQMGQRSQEPGRLTLGCVLLTACQHWWFWASAETLLILFAIYWMPRQRSTDCDSSSQQGSSSSEEEEEREEDGWEDTPDPHNIMGQVKAPDELGTLSSLCDWKFRPWNTFKRT